MLYHIICYVIYYIYIFFFFSSEISLDAPDFLHMSLCLLTVPLEHLASSTWLCLAWPQQEGLPIAFGHLGRCSVGQRAQDTILLYLIDESICFSPLHMIQDQQQKVVT